MGDKIIASVLVTFAILFLGIPLGFLGLILLHSAYLYFIVALVISLYFIVVLTIFEFFKTRRRKQIMSIVVSLILIGTAIPAMKQLYEDNMSTVGAEVNIYQYQPFQEDSLVKKLDEDSTLTLTEPLPILDGATAMYPLYAAFVEATYPENPEYLHDEIVMVSKTPDAYENLFNGTVDMIFAAAPSEQQKKSAESNGIKMKMTPIGREAFVFFVNKKNPINNLTLDDVRGIYSGEITNWSQVGGNDEEIRAFQRPEDSGSQTALQYLMEETPIMEAPTENIVSGMGGIIHEVAQYKNYKNAIGYTFRFYSTEMVDNDEIKLLAINGIEPTKETIRNGTYPITSEFYAVTANTTNPNVDKFLEWIVSPQGQKLVENVGYVPISE